MLKKIIVAVAVTTLMFGGIMSSQVSAVPGTDLQIIPIIVNGQKVKFPDTEPYINTDGRTMVPVRFVSEKLGAEVEWEADTQTAILHFEGKTIQMPIGSKTVSVDGEVQELDTAAEFTDGRTMVPLRFVSEVLGSNVEWDNDAHSVRVTDAAYQAKVDAGEVTLDPWGREYSKNYDESWIRLKDLESTGFYDFRGTSNSRSFIEKRKLRYKETADVASAKIRAWYSAQLNIDYRSIDEKAFIDAFLDNASGRISMNSYLRSENELYMKEYIKWVKENKVIAKGYADPEMSTALGAGVVFYVPTRFKFMIISATDTSRTFMDNWDVSGMSDSFELKKGVWYDGYSEVSMGSNVAYASFSEDHGIRVLENMFYKGHYFYNVGEK